MSEADRPEVHQLRRLAELACLTLDPDEEQLLAGHLARILQFMQLVREATASAPVGAAPSPVAAGPCPLRSDEPTVPDAGSILAQAPRARDGLFEVPLLVPRDAHER